MAGARTMIATFRNVVSAVIAAGLGFVSPARANWLVDFNQPAAPSVDADQVHLHFLIPTFLTSDIITTFSVAATSNSNPVSQFSYNLTVGGTCFYSDGITISSPTTGCEATSFGSPLVSGTGLELIATGNPNIYNTDFGGTLTFTNLAAVPEPASLTVLVVGLAGLGMVLRTRRAERAEAASLAHAKFHRARR